MVSYRRPVKRDEALTVECPKCKSKPGAVCTIVNTIMIRTLIGKIPDQLAGELMTKKQHVERYNEFRKTLPLRDQAVVDDDYYTRRQMQEWLRENHTIFQFEERSK